jgi:hypothetical protein
MNGLKWSTFFAKRYQKFFLKGPIVDFSLLSKTAMLASLSRERERERRNGAIHATLDGSSWHGTQILWYGVLSMTRCIENLKSKFLQGLLLRTCLHAPNKKVKKEHQLYFESNTLFFIFYFLFKI